MIRRVIDCYGFISGRYGLTRLFPRGIVALLANINPNAAVLDLSTIALKPKGP